MATPVPFRYIDGLPRTAQEQLERDFAHLQSQIAGSTSLYDAVIDPTGANDSGKHTYKSITQFTVGEAARLVTGNHLTVAVIGHPGTDIVETSPITLGCPVTFVGSGNQGAGQRAFGSAARPRIDFAANTITVTGTNWVNFVGIELFNSGALISSLVTGCISLHDCYVNGTLAGATTIAQVATSNLYATDSALSGIVSLAGTSVVMTSCFYYFSVPSTTLAISGGEFFWDGGGISIGASGAIVAVTGSARCYIRTSHGMAISDGTTSGSVFFNLQSSNPTYLDVGSHLTNLPAVTVGAAAGETAVRGVFAAVTISGDTNNNTRRFDGAVVGGTLDVTGPAQINAQLDASVAISNAILRGKAINANLAFTAPGSSPYLQLVGCTDSLVVAAYHPGAGAGQAYTIDAASARCLLVLAGTTDVLFATPSTNAGTTCAVVTEAGAPGGPPTGAAGGSLSGTYPNPGFAGRDTSTDSINKDLLPALLVGDTSGVQTLPVTTGGGAPTGAAGGSLGGTYPNPNFAGRDASVDKINQDMLPAMLVEGTGPFGINVYGAAQELALAQTHDLSGTWPFLKVTGISGQKVSANSPTDQDVLQYITGFNVGFVNVPPETISRQTKDYSKDFMLMGG